MARFRIKRAGFRMDMTPMVDVAFLLLTFFMLTTKFHPPEEVPVDLPFSHSEQQLPESAILTVVVAENDSFSMGVSSQVVRERLFIALVKPSLLASGHSDAAIRDSLAAFRLAETFPVKREELEHFVVMARLAEHGLRPVVRADADASFDAVDHVISVYKRANLLRFALVTNLEREDG